MRVATLVLAAGASRRMGRPKQLLRVGERTLLEITLDAALGQTDPEVYVVTGAENADINAILAKYPGAARGCNAEYEKGMGSSLAYLAGRVPADVDAYLVLLIDQPDLTVDYLDTLTRAFIADGGQRLHATRWPDGRTGPPAILPANLRPALLTLEGDRGARDLLRNSQDRLVVHCPPVPLVDLDTPEAYADYLRARGE